MDDDEKKSGTRFILIFFYLNFFLNSGSSRKPLQMEKYSFFIDF